MLLPETALMAAIPAPSALARPERLMVATDGLLLDHVTVAVQSALALFE